MKLLILRLFAVCLLIHLYQLSIAQCGAPTYQYGGTTPFNQTVINLPCGQNCTNIRFQAPHLKSSETYTASTIPYTPFAYTTPTGSEDVDLYDDDQYSDLINLPFYFCFYDSTYNSVVVGSNGIITFDAGAATCFNAWNISNPIPFGTGASCASAPNNNYPRASIMAAFMDLDPRTMSSPSDRKIEWRVEGVAPCRRFVVSYFHIGTFVSNCLNTPASFQIILHEGTGIIDVMIENKQCAATSGNNGARAILGVQDWTRLNAVSPADKNATIWTSQNEGYRFTPAGATSYFLRSELLTMSGTVLAVADTITTTAGLLDISFPNFCQTVASQQYKVRTFFASCSDPNSLMFTDDTITINRTTNLNATATTTASTCGAPSGTIVVNVPNLGTPPYQYSLDGGAPASTNNLTYTFNNVSAGTHSVFVTDNTGCTSTIPITVALNGNLPVTATPVATSCAGVNNGSITVTQPTVGLTPFQYSLNGSPFSTNNIFTNLASGTYTITVNDASGCTGTTTVTITTGLALTATTTATPTSCNGALNGSITVTPTSGTAPYQYSIDGAPYQGSNAFTNLSSGTHYIIVRDVNGCLSNSIAVNVAAGATITGTITSTATTCVGVNNGSITVTPTTGTAPYQFTMDGGPLQTSNIFTNVAAGVHVVTFRDATGCSSQDMTITVGSGAGITANATTTPTSCSGVNNGSITVTPTNGSAPYEYSLDGAAYQTGNVFTNLSSGVHFIVVRDALGCVSNSISVTITQGAGITGTAASTATSCNAAVDGTITVTPTTGTAPYQYSLDGGAYQTGNIFTNVSAGAHTVVLRDVNGCTSPGISVNVTQGPGITGTATATAASCTGINNGIITVTPTSGTGPYQYSYDGGALQPNNTYTIAAAGPHTVEIRDNIGCTSGTIQVTVPAGPGATGTVASTGASCPGVNNGTITVTTTSGIAPFQFSLDGGAYQTGNIFTNISGGNHTIVIRDNAGCVSASLPINVATGAALNVGIASTNTSCNGATNGTVTLTPANGSAPYQYSLNGGPAQPGNVFNNLAAGNYTAVVTDNNGCVANNLSTVINAGSGLTAGLNQINVTCNGLTNGSVTVNVAAPASPPLQYSLDNNAFQPGNTFTGLAAGSYTVYFRDNLGCTGSQNFTITQPLVLAANINTQAVRCNGQNNGVITVTASGGTAPYQYSLDNTNYQAGNTFNVVAGTYTVYVRDNNNCQVSQASVTVTEPALLTLNAATTNGTCAGGSDGVITATAGGGTAAYQYSINGTNFQSSNIFNVLPGNYTVTVRDANNCTSTTNSVVALTNNLTFTRGNDTTICEGSTAQLYVNSNATQYSWTNAATLTNAAGPNPVASPVTTTQYTVTATLGVCSTTGTITVNVNPAPLASAGLSNTEICFGQDAQLNASGGVSFQWSPPTYLSDPTIANPQVIQPQQTIQYTLQVTDANGCRSLIPGAATITVTPPIKVTVSPVDSIVSEGDSIRLQAISIGTIYTWTNGATLSNPNIPNPIATMPPGSLGSVYVYTVTASTPAGCAGEPTSVTLRVYKGPDLYMPTAFTPNGDGLNEIFTPIPVGIKELNYFRVYNRAGQLLFSTSELYKGWDGNYKGIKQGTGVYVWVVQGVTKDNRQIFRKGTVTLIR